MYCPTPLGMQNWPAWAYLWDSLGSEGKVNSARWFFSDVLLEADGIYPPTTNLILYVA